MSRVYESGEEITVALLRENSLFGVLSLLTGHRSDRFYHAIAFTRVEMITASQFCFKSNRGRCFCRVIVVAGSIK